MTQQAMGGLARVTAFEDRLRRKALHVGTYEAAIHNMLRRIADQADRGKQFYLYRVHLVPAITVRESWISDPGGFVGDVPLTEVCPPGIDVTRSEYSRGPGETLAGPRAFGDLPRPADPDPTPRCRRSG